MYVCICMATMHRMSEPRDSRRVEVNTNKEAKGKEGGKKQRSGERERRFLVSKDAGGHLQNFERVKRVRVYKYINKYIYRAKSESKFIVNSA